MVQEQEQEIWTREKSNLTSIASLIGGNLDWDREEKVRWHILYRLI